VVAALPHGVTFGGEGLAALGPADLAWLGDALSRVVPMLPSPVARADVEFVLDARMRALHARHLAVDETTDVMTFALNAPGEPVDADVAVCVDEARRRGGSRAHGARGERLLYARHARRHELRRELLLDALHGLLHCTGFDDRTPDEHARMHAEEDRILEAAGFGRLFEAGEGPA
jgi:rRNA maturation RNase YbeY